MSPGDSAWSAATPEACGSACSARRPGRGVPRLAGRGSTGYVFLAAGERGHCAGGRAHRQALGGA
eukprot:14272733-Alexandrium_andersonii.AAC.1